MSVQFVAATSTSIPVHVVDQNNLDALDIAANANDTGMGGSERV